MARPADVHPLRDLVGEVAARLTSEQLFALAARVAAAEATPPEPAPAFTLAASAALDLDATVRRAAALWCDGAGIDADLFGPWYAPQLVRVGVAETDALAALRRVTGWRPRSEEDRERAIARDMLAVGWSPEQIADALRKTAPC